MTISEIIAALNSVKKEYGDLPVCLSCDSEGNSYGTTGDTMSDSIQCDKKRVIIYLFEEHMELDELPS